MHQVQSIRQPLSTGKASSRMSTSSSLWLLAVLLLLQVQVDLSEANRFAWSAALRPVVWQSSWESHLPQASRDASNAATDSDAATADGLTLAAVARYSSRQDQEHLRKTSSAHLWRRKSRLRNIDESDEECYQGFSSEPCSRVATVPRARAAAAAAFSPSSPAHQKIKQSSARGNSSPTASRVTALPASAHRPLNFWENMFCGAISRSLAQTIMHPANTMKTMLQSSKSQSIADLLQPRQLQRLTSGAGANLLLSIPSGAVNFAVLELVRKQLDKLVESNDDADDDDRKGKGKSRNGSKRKALLGPSLDFLSSSISTIACSVVSTPQMVITDNIMAGNYPNLPAAIRGLGANGIVGFYRGWWPGLVGKIPSYALTWTLFQQLKEVRTHLTQRPAKDWENAFMGCLASGTTVSIMIPMDTIKTRLVTQMSNAPNAYKGIVDCAVRVAKEEGIGAFYRGLPPRLVSVVPMIGIQFGVYEFMRRTLRERKVSEALRQEEESESGEAYGRVAVFEEALMEVAASSDDPNPAPRISVRIAIKKKKKSRQAKNWLKQRR